MPGGDERARVAHVGEHEVEHDGVGRHGVGQPQELAAVGRGADVLEALVRLQPGGDERREAEGVVADQDAEGHDRWHGSRRPLPDR